MNTHTHLRTTFMASAATALSLYACAGSAAWAQQAPNEAAKTTADAEDGDVIVVTGIRASIENTIALKKGASQILEAVSMEDIGKLPDQSIASAIARLPGLAAQRVDGRSQSISIRGLSPDFSTTLLNGREQVSTGDNRSAEFDQYPAELMAGVVVYKTPVADLIGQGLSGTVDMRTIRPLDHRGNTLFLNARGETGTLGALNPDATNRGYRVSGVYIGKFLDDTLGVTLGAAHMESPQQFQQFDSWGYTALPDKTMIATGSKPWNKSDDLKRTSATLTLQYRPNSAFESTLDVFYTKFKDNVRVRGMQLPLYNQAGVALTSYQATDGFADDGTYTGVKAVVQQGTNKRDDDLFSIGWNGRLTTGAWVTSLDASWSSVKRDDRFLSSYAGTGRWGTGATDTIGFTTNADNVKSYTHNLDYGSYDTILLGGPQAWGGYSASTGNGVRGNQDGYLTYRSIKDDLVNINLSSEVALDGGFLSSIKLGVNFGDRKKRLSVDESYLSLTASYNQYLKDGTFVSVNVPDAYRMGTISLAKYGLGDVLAYDIDGLLRDGYYTKVPNLSLVTARAGWDVHERTYTGYVRGNIDSTLGSVAMRGNVGMQVIATDQSSGGQLANQATFVATPVRDGATYVDFLPNLNLAFNLGARSIVRVGAARSIMRARMDQLTASSAYMFSPQLATSTDLANSPWAATAGNARLRPWRAISLDLSYEYYFAPDAYISLAGFYKHLENYVYRQSTLADFTGYDTNGVTPRLWQGYVSQYVNGKGGNIHGAEFTLSAPARLISDSLDGFGVTLNASYTDSNIVQDPSSPTTPLPGLSKYVTNATVFFEKNGFSARLNHSYRSTFLGQVTGFDSSLTQRNIKAQGWLDGQIGYSFDSGKLKGASAYLQVINITGETMTSYLNNDPKQLSAWQNYGTQFLLGVGYSF